MGRQLTPYEAAKGRCEAMTDLCQKQAAKVYRLNRLGKLKEAKEAEEQWEVFAYLREEQAMIMEAFNVH